MGGCPKCNDPYPRSMVSYIGTFKPGGLSTMCGRCAAMETKKIVSLLKVVRRERVPLLVGVTTLAASGINRNSVDPYPIKRGNCCSITHPRVDGIKTGPEYRCRNMNGENISEASRRWPELKNGVDVDILEDGSCRVVDERLPEAWRRHFCPSCGHFEDDEAEAQFMEQQLPSSDSVEMGYSGESKLGQGYFYAPYTPKIDLSEYSEEALAKFTRYLKPINPEFFKIVKISDLTDAEIGDGSETDGDADGAE